MIELPALAIHWLLAAVFAEALHHKLESIERFAASFGAYRLLPQSWSPAWTNSGARCIVLLEALTVLLNIFAFKAGLLFAAVLLLGYAIGMGINRMRGRSFIDCGCGDEPVPITPALIVRNLLLVATAAAAMTTSPIGADAIPWSQLLTELAAAIAGWGIYRCANQLIANAARFRLAGYGAE